MRAWAFLLLLVAACDRSRGQQATGTLVFTPEAVAGSQLPAFFATEAEILRSTALAQRVGESLRLDGGASNIQAQRRGDSLVMEVSVSSHDPLLARTWCNDLLARYLEHRLQSKLQPAQARAQFLSAELDQMKPAAPEAQALTQQLAQANLDSQLRINDARVLDNCR